jgi:hypothetical protein
MDVAIISPSGRGSIETSKCNLGTSLNKIMLDKFKKSEITSKKHPEIFMDFVVPALTNTISAMPLS